MDRKKLSILIAVGLVLVCAVGILLWLLLPVRENVKRELPAIVFTLGENNTPLLEPAEKTTFTFDGEWSYRRVSPEEPRFEGAIRTGSVGGISNEDSDLYSFLIVKDVVVQGFGTYFDAEGAVWNYNVFTDEALEQFDVRLYLWRTPDNVYNPGVEYRVIAPAETVEEAMAIAADLNIYFPAE